MFYGYKLGMTRRETMNTACGEMMDLLACMAIENGGAEQKRKKKTTAELLME